MRHRWDYDTCHFALLTGLCRPLKKERKKKEREKEKQEIVHIIYLFVKKYDHWHVTCKPILSTYLGNLRTYMHTYKRIHVEEDANERIVNMHK